VALDLNEKPWYVPLLLGLVLGGALIFVLNHYVFKDIRQRNTNIEENIRVLQREIQKGRAAQRDLPRLEEEIRNLELELDRLRRILPRRKETDDLLKKLKQLIERGHFSLMRFTPQAFVDHDFYLEWPMRVTLRGTYHELGLFFDRLSRFSRIINVSELTLKPTQGDASVEATFTQQTFIYKEEEETTTGGQP
jgi:type IV pilus assembly protein PilO